MLTKRPGVWPFAGQVRIAFVPLESGLQVVEEVRRKMATEWECMECGYLHEGLTPPGKCPDCGSTAAWEKVEYVDDWDEEEESEGDED